VQQKLRGVLHGVDVQVRVAAIVLYWLCVLVLHVRPLCLVEYGAV
jgi:hypothetical protein